MFVITLKNNWLDEAEKKQGRKRRLPARQVKKISKLIATASQVIEGTNEVKYIID